MSLIFVLLFWLGLSGGHVHVAQTELVAVTQSVDVCRNADLKELLAHTEDAKANLGKGLVPKVVCGIAVPDPEPPKEAPSSPGNGQWDKGPSAAL